MRQQQASLCKQRCTVAPHSLPRTLLVARCGSLNVARPRIVDGGAARAPPPRLSARRQFRGRVSAHAAQRAPYARVLHGRERRARPAAFLCGASRFSVPWRGRRRASRGGCVRAGPPLRVAGRRAARVRVRVRVVPRHTVPASRKTFDFASSTRRDRARGGSCARCRCGSRRARPLHCTRRAARALRGADCGGSRRRTLDSAHGRGRE